MMIEMPGTFESVVHCLRALSAQTYVGRKRAAVDRICVGVPAGEVKSQSSLKEKLIPPPFLHISIFQILFSCVCSSKETPTLTDLWARAVRDADVDIYTSAGGGEKHLYLFALICVFDSECVCVSAGRVFSRALIASLSR